MSAEKARPTSATKLVNTLLAKYFVSR